MVEYRGGVITAAWGVPWGLRGGPKIEEEDIRYTRRQAGMGQRWVRAAMNSGGIGLRIKITMVGCTKVIFPLKDYAVSALEASD